MSPLTEEEGQALLAVARLSLESAVLGCPVSFLPAQTGVLAEKRGVFVTLRQAGELRGCIGHVEPGEALAGATAACAASAALQDPRFPPVVAGELPDIRIEISVLSTLEDVTPGEIELGRHGLMISAGIRRGLLLPQVPAQWGWSRRQFLEQTCTKAGLDPGAWRRGARIQAFTTQVIAEPDAFDTPPRPAEGAPLGAGMRDLLGRG